MPYEIKKVPKGWKVFTKGTDRSHSNNPLPLARAKAQLKALYASADDFSGGMIGGFDDRDFDRLYGIYGGAEDDEEPAPVQDDSGDLVKSSDLKDFDVEDATGEPEYLKQAKAFAKKAGYKDASSLRLADDGKHKLVLRGVKFGSINNNDYIIYRQHFPSIAEKKRKSYLARACKIKGDWAKDRYSPNSLAINILWDGSSKKGGDDWWGKDEDVYYDENGKPISKDEYEKQFSEPVKMPVEPEAPEELPEQPQFVGDPSQFKPQPYDPNNPLMYMVGGAVPLNKKLYERAKAEVYPRYKKPSAYRSGAVVKRYKELGGKFKDDNGRPLARWFKEEWKDVGNKEYPVYRPTKRISKDTPLTVSEIDPENLKLQIKEKQKIKGDSNLPAFKGGRLAQTDAEETAVAKKILQKVAGEQNAEVKAISETPMGDDNIRRYFPNAKILTYKQLADVDNISELLPALKSYFFLLYEQSPNTGHWVVINRYMNNGKDTICFFCSYGSKIDAPLRWNSPQVNQELGQGQPYLTQLLQKSGKYIEYNKVQYQSKTSPVATCGAFATLWIKANLRENMTLNEFHEWISEIKNETGLSYDAIASNAISQRTF
jgi:hypothetical protein